MILSPTNWRRVVIALSVINAVSAVVVFGMGMGQTMHAASHAAAAIAFGLWAQFLKQDLPATERGEQNDLSAGLDALEFEVSKLRQELSDTHQRIDFAERLLAQRPEQHRVQPPERP